MKLTELEFTVLLRFARGEDPWGGNRGTSHSRKASQAIHRLIRKGALEPTPDAPYHGLTEAGKLYLVGCELAGKISDPKA